MKRYSTLWLLLLFHMASAQQGKEQLRSLQPEISAGGGFSGPLSPAMKNDLSLGSGHNLSADVFLPLIRTKGEVLPGSVELGLTATAGYVSQQSGGSLLQQYGPDTRISEGDARGRSLIFAGGPRLNWKLQRFRIAPGFNIGYQNFSQDAYTLVREGTGGLPASRILESGSIRTGGLLLSPGIRTGFSLTKHLSVWNSFDFNFGPSLTAVRSFASYGGLLRRANPVADITTSAHGGRMQSFDIRTGLTYSFAGGKGGDDPRTDDPGKKILYPPQPTAFPSPDTIYSKDRKPVQLRWKPVSPKPAEAVVYRITLEQSEKDRKEFTPLYKAETRELFTDIPDRVIYNRSEGAFRWKVEGLHASSQLPLTDCLNGCSSGWVYFSMLSGGCVGSFEIVSDSCLGMDQEGRSKYRICATYTANPANTCNISFYDAQNATINSMPGNNLANIITDINGGGVSNYTFTPSNPSVITPGDQVSICFDYTAAGNPANFVAYALCLDGMENHAPNFANNNDTISLDPCICKDCDDDYITFSGQQTSFNSSQRTATISGDLQIASSDLIKRVEIQINSFSWSSSPENCSPGITRNPEAGMFHLPASLGGNWPGMPALDNHSQGNLNVAKALKWINGNGVQMQGSQPLSLTVGLPGGPPNVADDCCQLNYVLCLTVTVEDINCKVCTKTFCLDPFTN